MKYILTILLIVELGTANAQFINTTTVGSNTTMFKSKGGIGADSAIVFLNSFPDTTTANFSVISKYNSIIRIGTAYWYRTLAPNKWNPFASGITGSFLFISDTAAMLSNYYNKTAADGRFVHLTGDEVVGGNKYFSGRTYFYEHAYNAPAANYTNILADSSFFGFYNGESSGKATFYYSKHFDGTTWASRLYYLPGSDGTLALTSDIPSITGKLNISDTSGMLFNYYNQTAINSRLALKVNYTDTATMMSGYYRSTNPSGYITSSAITGKVNYTDTSTMLSAYYNKGVSDGKFVHLTGNETIAGDKTFSNKIYSNSSIQYKESSSILSGVSGYSAISFDTTRFIFGNGTSTHVAQFNYGGLGYKVYGLPTASGTIALTSDIPSITGKLNISDTSGMLFNYYNQTAADGRFVHLTGNETIGGTKTFNTSVNVIATNSGNAYILNGMDYSNTYHIAYLGQSGSNTGYLALAYNLGNQATFINGNGYSKINDNTYNAYGVGVGFAADNGSGAKLQVNGGVYASSYVKSGGTSTQYLMADGSVTTSSGLFTYNVTDPNGGNGSSYTPSNYPVALQMGGFYGGYISVTTSSFTVNGNYRLIELKSGASSVNVSSAATGQDYFIFNSTGSAISISFTLKDLTGTTLTTIPANTSYHIFYNGTNYIKI